MGRTCTVCAHLKRADIDRRLAGPANLSGLARDYGLDRNALRRHRDEHLSGLLVRFAEDDLAVSVGGVRAEMRGLYERALDLLAMAEGGVVVGVDGTRPCITCSRACRSTSLASPPTSRP